MKILVINTVPTNKNGISNVIFNYLQMIDHRYIQMDIVMINDADQYYKDILIKQRCRFFVMPRSGKTVIKYLINLVRLIRAQKYDAVHIHGNSHTMVLDLFAAFCGGCHIRITHSHNTTCKFISVHKLLTPFFNMLYTHGLACGINAGEWLYGKHPFTVINNGVDTVKFAFNERKRNVLRKKMGISDDTILLGNVGHFFGNVKNQTFIIKIFNELYGRDKSYRLCLIGDGPLRINAVHEVELLGLKDKVTFTGDIENVEDYLNSVDLIVMPSLYEGLPLTLVEEQANGLQCVCSDAITCEVDKTGNLKFISLKLSAVEWADEIQKFYKKSDRILRSKNAIVDIKKAGYSIYEEAQKLSRYYNNLVHT